MSKQMDTGALSDEALVEMMNTGNQLAFATLYDRYSKPLYQLFYAKLKSKEKAEDFLQNLFMKILKNGKSFNLNKKFSTWIFTIAHNMCKNEYRDLSRKMVHDENFNIESIENNRESRIDLLDSSIFSKHLTLALNNLSQNHQSSFILRFKHEFSIKEISEVLECSEGTTKSRIFYTLKKLSIELKQFNPHLI
jgi:RNA polymerase sigma-70 factor (ECF subfamily)